jgi:hypothetical protein
VQMFARERLLDRLLALAEPVERDIELVLVDRPEAAHFLERVEELQRQTGLRPDREVPDVASAFCGCPWIFSTAGTGSDLSRTACG